MTPLMPKSRKPKRPTHIIGHAQTEWNRVVRMLDELGVLEIADQHTIELYCEAYSDWRIAKEKCDKTGIALVSQSKDKVEVRRNPFFAAKLEASDRCVKLLQELRLTPRSRNRKQEAQLDRNSDDEKQTIMLGGESMILKFSRAER